MLLECIFYRFPWIWAKAQNEDSKRLKIKEMLLSSWAVAQSAGIRRFAARCLGVSKPRGRPTFQGHTRLGGGSGADQRACDPLAVRR